MLTVRAKASIPTEWWVFEMRSYSRMDDDPMPHLAMLHENWTGADNVLVRIHSECLTGDLFGSARCECGNQLRRALMMISTEGGVLIYLRQEGRGIGLTEKLKAYELQDAGRNTIDANLELGHAPDERSYDIAVSILADLGISSIRLLTNNPDKIRAIEDSQIDLVERVPLIVPGGEAAQKYMETKRLIMGHLLDD